MPELSTDELDPIRLLETLHAIRRGDFGVRMPLDRTGLAGRIADEVNAIIDLSAGLAAELGRINHAVGKEGRIGTRAALEGARGGWAACVESVNGLIDDLARPTAEVGRVIGAVADGDLGRKMALEIDGRPLRGEFLRTATMVNTMVDQLSSFASEVTRVAREVGVEGKLGGQARVPGAAGTWRDLTDNVNQLAANLTTQVRAIAEVATAVTEGDLTRSITVSAAGEVAALKDNIGIVLNTIAAGMRTEELLKQSTSLADELRSQQGELTESNKRLEHQAKSLQASEDRLKLQQEELQRTNEELEERSRLLQIQNVEVERKNREIEQAKVQLEERAQQLSLSSRYKSEFLANMSHELRTPLNSLLILAKMLQENPDQNLTEKQIDFARTIHQAGADLMALINDILDLSKIESGTMQVDVETCALANLTTDLQRQFAQVAAERKLSFEVEVDPSAPAALYTDGRRLQQILKNLLSNAFKFTERGGVALRVATAESGWSYDAGALNAAEGVVAFEVRDTGIGIPVEKQRVIFEAFQQADGSTARKYGGTGLGLSISRELARLLGGEVTVRSRPGQGSTFTLYVPRALAPSAARAPGGARPGAEAHAGTARPAAHVEPSPIEDDRASIRAGDRVLLVVEDDPIYAAILVGLARERSFRAIVATRGESALQLAREMRPDAITLDLVLPDMDGWSLLDLLKRDPGTRQIPVHVITGRRDDQRLSLRLGAAAALQKPATREELHAAIGRVVGIAEGGARRLLVVAASEAERAAVRELVGDGDVEILAAASGAEAMETFRKGPFDCVVLDPALPDMAAAQLVRQLRASGDRPVPVILYGKLDDDVETEIALASDEVVLKRASSPEQLLDETSLFLHRVETRLPPPKREMLRRAHEPDPVLAGKTALLVDDDVRNAFALTSALERHRMKVIYAEGGAAAIELGRRRPDVVLMDVMMPEMDGLEAIRRLRATVECATVPIIAITAKAMKGDREACLRAGASDYLAKPVDTNQLLSLLRVWLYDARRDAPAEEVRQEA